jgi:hypothetical protein
VTDRLPVPLLDPAADGVGTERASASPARLRLATVAPLPVPRAASASLPERLSDVQTWMIGAITSDAPDREREAALLTPGPQLSAHERFHVYRYGYRARLVECLLDDYPVVAKALGEDAFEALCHAYVERHPSRSPNLNAFGRHMAAFIRDDAVAIERRVFLSELASLEWCITEMIHAAASPPFDFSSLAALPVEAWGGARLERADTVRVLSFTHPVNAYFQKLRSGGEAEIPGPAESATAVYRKGWTIWRMDLTPAMTRVLTALLGGVTIGEALDRMGVDGTDPDALAEAERSVMVWFREWVEAGLFCGVTLSS